MIPCSPPFCLFIRFCSVGAIYDCFLLLPSSLSVWLVLLVLEISADWLKEALLQAAHSPYWEKWSHSLHTYTSTLFVCVCLCTCVFIEACACVCGGSVWVFIYVVLWNCLCEIVCVCLSQRVSVCSYGVCIWAFMCVSCLASPHTASNSFLLWNRGNWTVYGAVEHNISFSHCVLM